MTAHTPSLRVRIIVGANAYACITETTPTSETTMDVQLKAGLGAARSLRESAQEMRTKAKRLLESADLIERAATMAKEQP